MYSPSCSYNGGSLHGFQRCSNPQRIPHTSGSKSQLLVSKNQTLKDGVILKYKKRERRCLALRASSFYHYVSLISAAPSSAVPFYWLWLALTCFSARHHQSGKQAQKQRSYSESSKLSNQGQWLQHGIDATWTKLSWLSACQ